VADRAAAVAVEHRGALADLGRDGEALTEEQAFVATEIADDLDLGSDLGVALDEATDGGGKAGGEATGGQEGDLLLLLAHGNVRPWRAGRGGFRGTRIATKLPRLKRKTLAGGARGCVPLRHGARRARLDRPPRGR